MTDQADKAIEVTDGVDTFCPKCKGSFNCRVDDVVNCQCYSVSLSEETREDLAGTSQDCLCSSCLERTEAESRLGRSKPLKHIKPVLIENLHYYMEGRYCVFTALYHRQRGYCCKNNCRHCPFGDES